MISVNENEEIKVRKIDDFSKRLVYKGKDQTGSSCGESLVKELLLLERRGLSVFKATRRSLMEREKMT